MLTTALKGSISPTELLLDSGLSRKQHFWFELRRASFDGVLAGNLASLDWDVGDQGNLHSTRMMMRNQLTKNEDFSEQ